VTSWVRQQANELGKPIYAIRRDTPEHAVKALQTMLGLHPSAVEQRTRGRESLSGPPGFSPDPAVARAFSRHRCPCVRDDDAAGTLCSECRLGLAPAKLLVCCRLSSVTQEPDQLV
jgi:hypothetical protein